MSRNRKRHSGLTQGALDFVNFALALAAVGISAWIIAAVLTTVWVQIWEALLAMK